jgi:hypothetical protein
MALVRFRRSRKHSTIISFLDEADASLCSSGCVQRNGQCDPPGGICRCAEDDANSRKFANA